MSYQTEKKKYLSILHQNKELHWKNGIMMKIMYMSCSVHSRRVRTVNLSMPIKAQAAGCLRRNVPKYGKYYASLLYEYEVCENQADKKPEVEAEVLGIDYAMSGMAVFSDGTRCEYPGYYRKAIVRLTRERRKL